MRFHPKEVGSRRILVPLGVLVWVILQMGCALPSAAASRTGRGRAHRIHAPFPILWPESLEPLTGMGRFGVGRSYFGISRGLRVESDLYKALFLQPNLGLRAELWGQGKILPALSVGTRYVAYGMDRVVGGSRTLAGLQWDLTISALARDRLLFDLFVSGFLYDRSFEASDYRSDALFWGSATGLQVTWIPSRGFAVPFGAFYSIDFEFGGLAGGLSRTWSPVSLMLGLQWSPAADRRELLLRVGAGVAFDLES